MHTHRRTSGNPYTIHPQPNTAIQQAAAGSANNFHSPYYYCCYLSIDLPLEEHPWGKAARNQQSATL
jgi:hypothetical protein